MPIHTLAKGFPSACALNHDPQEGFLMKIGYIRVSTEEQNHDRQIDSLGAICEKLHIEHISAVSEKRPVFEKTLRTLKPGDTMVVHDLDRAFRSTIDALAHIEKLKKRGVAFQILSLHADTNTPAGELVYTLMAAFAQYERRILSQRTKEGMDAARRRGVHVGRPRKLNMRDTKEAKQALERGCDLDEIAHSHACSAGTVLRAIARLNTEPRL